MTREPRTQRGRRASPKAPPRGDCRGFTLIELMVVIVILGLLIGLVGPNVIKAITDAGKGTAETQMHNMGAAIDLYRIDKRALPQSLEELTQPDKNGNPYMKSLPNDPWGQPYEYKVTDTKTKSFEISSWGEDRQAGTEDDIYYPPREAR